ncbi:hypothetical protein JW887_02360 [Candidatus Dojkabacteria bacterium]|nr:hypothetical protein [Candidatus Dojkabacteria bacterium]
MNSLSDSPSKDINSILVSDGKDRIFWVVLSFIFVVLISASAVLAFLNLETKKPDISDNNGNGSSEEDISQPNSGKDSQNSGSSQSVDDSSGKVAGVSDEETQTGISEDYNTMYDDSDVVEYQGWPNTMPVDVPIFQQGSVTSSKSFSSDFTPGTSWIVNLSGVNFGANEIYADELINAGWNVQENSEIMGTFTLVAKLSSYTLTFSYYSSDNTGVIIVNNLSM